MFSIWLFDIIYRHCKYYALCCCVFKIVVLYVKRWFVLYCSRARVRLSSPFRYYLVESLYNDVPECIGMKTFRKAREIHSFSMTFSSDAFLFLEGYFNKRCILTCKVILSYSCLGFMLYNLVYHDTPRIWWTHIWLCPIAQGTNLWYSSTFA